MLHSGEEYVVLVFACWWQLSALSPHLFPFDSPIPCYDRMEEGRAGRTPK